MCWLSVSGTAVPLVVLGHGSDVPAHDSDVPSSSSHVLCLAVCLFLTSAVGRQYHCMTLMV